MKVANSIETRFLHNRDFDRLIEIDCDTCGKYSWEPDDLFKVIKNENNTCGIVAVDETDFPLGFCLYSLLNVECFDILHFAVDKAEQRKGVGTALVNKMKNKLNEERFYISVDVPEGNLAAQLFFKEMKFKARLVRNTFEDIIRFKYGEIL